MVRSAVCLFCCIPFAVHAGPPIDGLQPFDTGKFLNATPEAQLNIALKSNADVQKAEAAVRIAREELDRTKTALVGKLLAARTEWEVARGILDQARDRFEILKQAGKDVAEQEKILQAAELVYRTKEDAFLQVAGVARWMPAQDAKPKLRDGLSKEVADKMEKTLRAVPKLEDRFDLPLQDLLKALQENAGTKLLFQMQNEDAAKQAVQLPKLPEAQPLGNLLMMIEDTSNIVFYVRDYGVLACNEERDGMVRLADVWKEMLREAKK